MVAGPAVAQTTDVGYADSLSTSLAAVANAMHVTIRRNLAEAAEAMPADEYAFRPTPQVRTFGQLIAHIAETNFFFCAGATGRLAPSTVANVGRIMEKAALVEALNNSLATLVQNQEVTIPLLSALLIRSRDAEDPPQSANVDQDPPDE